MSLARAAPYRQQAGPLDAAAYWQKIQDTLAAIDAVDQADAAAVRRVLNDQASGWDAITQVRLGDGTVVPVDSSYLSGLLRADPPDLNAIRKYLRNLLAESQRWHSPRASDSGGQAVDYSKALSGVLARDEFNWAASSSAPNPIQEWLDQLRRRILEWLDNLFPSEVMIGIPLLDWIFVVVGALALAAILWYVLQGLARGLADEAALPENGDGSDEIISAEAAARRAEETARLGDYRSAVRWLYLSSLLILEERELLRYDRTRTNREYLRSVAHLPELSAALRSVIDVFDRVWYGFTPIGETEFRQYAGRVKELRQIR